MPEDRLIELIQRLRAEADAADFTDLAGGRIRPVPRTGFFGRLRTRAAAAIAATVVSVGGLGGVAYASNGSGPGDLLYGLDRALEAVGIGNGGAAERISEAMVLTEHGSPAHGLEHAATVVPEQAGPVLDAAAVVGPSANGEVNDQVLALLTYISENLGNIDGQTVADLAHAIGGKPEDTPGEPPSGLPVGPPDDTPVGPPGQTPVGPPDGVPAGGTTTTSATTTTTTTTTTTLP